MEKENWINEILDSADGLRKATPDTSLFSRIEARISEKELPTKTVWLAAASIAVLIFLNLAAIRGNAEKQREAKDGLFTLMQDTNQLYR